MIEIALLPREELTARFGCSRRLAIRLTALLGRGIAVSAGLLKAATPGSALEKLLLAKPWLKERDRAEAILMRLLRQRQFSRLRADMPLAVVAQGEWQVIAAVAEIAEEEANAADRPLASVADVPPPVIAAVETKSPRPDDAARLRANIFAAPSAAEQVTALRQLALAPCSESEKLAIFLQALANDAQALRAAAAQAMRRFGLETEVLEALRSLVEGSPPERRMAAERVAVMAPRASPLSREALLMAAMGVMRDSRSDETAVEAAVAVLASLAPHLPPSLATRDDVLRVLMDRIALAGYGFAVKLRPALAAMDRLCPGAPAARLLAEAETAQAPEYRGSLLALVCDLTISADAKCRLLHCALEVLTHLPDDLPLVRSLENWLLQVGDEALTALAGRLGSCDVSHQRHFLRFFDNALRSLSLAASTRETIAQAAAEFMDTAPKQVRSDMIETCLLRQPDLSAALRRRIAVALLRDFRDYLAIPYRECLVKTLASLGQEACEPLLQTLHEQCHAADAGVIAAALGYLGAEMAASGHAAQAEDILRELPKILYRQPACRDDILLAMGRIGGQSGISAVAVKVIFRTIYQHVRGKDEDGPAIEALGLICGGAGLDANDMRNVIDLALRHLEADPPDIGAEVKTVDGEEVFCFDKTTEVYSSLLPSCLACVEHIMRNPQTPLLWREDILARLLRRWEQVDHLGVLWGPANVTALTSALGRIGVLPVTSADQRLRIARALARRYREPAALDALIAILAMKDDNAELDRLAGTLAIYLLKILEQTLLAAEDQERYLRLLGRLAQRGRFALKGAALARLYERMTQALLRGLRHGVAGVLARLLAIRDARLFPEPQHNLIAEEVSRFTSLAQRM